MDNIHAQVKDTLRREAPLSRTYCETGCIQLSAIPVLAEGKVIGAVVLGQALAYLLLEYHEISGIDIGLLIPQAGESTTPLGEWDLQLSAMTNRSAIEPLLQTLATTHPLPETGEDSWTLEVADRILETSLFPLLSRTQGKAVAVLVADVSRPMAQTRQAVKTNALIAIFGLLVSEALLLILLWRPSSRIKETVEFLPLLAEHAFDQVRQRLRTQSARWFEDETDVLCRNAYTLAGQLETLQFRAIQQDAYRGWRYRAGPGHLQGDRRGPWGDDMGVEQSAGWGAIHLCAPSQGS